MDKLAMMSDELVLPEVRGEQGSMKLLSGPFLRKANLVSEKNQQSRKFPGIGNFSLIKKFKRISGLKKPCSPC